MQGTREGEAERADPSLAWMGTGEEYEWRPTPHGLHTRVGHTQSWLPGPAPLFFLPWLPLPSSTPLLLIHTRLVTPL